MQTLRAVKIEAIHTVYIVAESTEWIMVTFWVGGLNYSCWGNLILFMFGVTESSRVVGGTCSVDGEMENTDVIFAEKRERRNLKRN
jgi:hypothetical protein